MRTLLDFTPLHQSSVGFDRVFDLLESAARTRGDNYPPFDSIKLGEDRYRITLAVAGFSEDELAVSTQDNSLIVSGERKRDTEGEYLHRGIAARVFSRRFELAEHVRVVGARLVNGLLSVDLQREVPDAMKPRRIPIDVDESERAAAIRQLRTETA